METVDLPDERVGCFLISDEEWWVRLCDRNREGKETDVFVRRNRVGPLKASKIFFYVGKPLMQVCCVADFVDRLVGDYRSCGMDRGMTPDSEIFESALPFFRVERQLSS